MTDIIPTSVNAGHEAVDAQVDTSVATQVPATPEFAKKDSKRSADRLQAAMDMKDQLSEYASMARKSMLRAEGGFKKFSAILLDLQNTERGHIALLQEMEDIVEEQQNIIRQHTDRMDSTEEHEVDCIAIDMANAQIRVSLLPFYLRICASILTAD
jgi:hypothetical protein